MNNPSTPVLDRQAVGGCGCFAEVPPLPMGCAVCGHAPYAHGCPDRPADHEYVQPSGELLEIRLRVRRAGDRSLPCFERPASAPTGPSRLGCRRRPTSRPRRKITCASSRSAVTPSSYRPLGRYGVPLQILARYMKQARPTLPTTGRALDRIEVQSVTDSSSTRPKPTSPETTIPQTTTPQTTIPGWRLILSDAGRLWASRKEPFSAVAFEAGAERTVDADTLDALRAETERQEAIAREAIAREAHEQQAAGQVIS